MAEQLTLKRVDELKAGDRVRMSIGHADVVETEPLENGRTRLTFLYGAVQVADNDLTVAVLSDEEWAW